jgi:maltokinase
MLGAFVRRQRWFSGRDREIESYEVEDAGMKEGDPAVVFVLLSVAYTDGGAERYNLPLSIRPAGRALQADLSLVADGSRAGGDVQVVDALVDPEAGWAFWRLIAEGGSVKTLLGEVRAWSREYDLGAGGPQEVRPLQRDQSNSSVVRGDRELLKCFRKLERESSPEMEMLEALRIAGFEHIAAPLGAIEYVRAGGENTVLALLQPYLHNATDGWALAMTSLRDLYAAAEDAPVDNELRIRETVDEQGSDFTPEASRLGSVVAEMHLALSSDRVAEDMRAEPAGQEQLNAWATEMEEDLNRLVAARSDALAPAHQQSALQRIRALRDLPGGGSAIRHHGDLHLGQTARTDSGWVILDFEGEPSRSVAARRRRSSPLRDVAGMLRSFDYAASIALLERRTPEDRDWGHLQAHGDVWAAVNREAFLHAYLEVVEPAGLLPKDEGVLIMLRAFETQKAIYEVTYELAHRPDYVWIPLRFLARPA